MAFIRELGIACCVRHSSPLKGRHAWVGCTSNSRGSSVTCTFLRRDSFYCSES